MTGWSFCVRIRNVVVIERGRHSVLSLSIIQVIAVVQIDGYWV
jgi:hypothetical protein